jgi:GxxExxY protein
MITQKLLDSFTYTLIGCAIEVHKELGPGLLESVYHRCFLKELSLRNFTFQSQLNVPIQYKGTLLDADLRLDVLVEDLIVVELKAVEALHPLYDAQLLTYMKLLQKPKGLLINFNCINIFKEGQKTMVNELYRSLPKQ